MLTIYAVILSAVLASAIYLSVCWFVHLDMVNSKCPKSGWGSYLTFKKWFNSYQWKGDDCHQGSVWNKEKKCKYHAGIIYFEGIGMKITNPISYMFVVF